MIIFSVSDSIQVVNGTTDWMQGWGAIIQGVGALVAIFASIWGFKQLNKDSKEKQKQIDSLTTLSEESKTANSLFKSQIDEDRRIRKVSIQPRFIVKVSNEDKPLGEKIFILQNLGGEARNIGITNLPNKKVKVVIGISELQRKEFAGLRIYVNHEYDVLSINKDDADASIHFIDIDNNLYSQHLTGRYLFSSCSNIVLDDPIAVKSNSDESEN